MLLSLEVLTGARLPPDTTFRCQKSTVYSTKRISGLSHEPHRFAVQPGCDTCPTEDRQHGKSSLTKDGIFCRVWCTHRFIRDFFTNEQLVMLSC
jgi:hypothetical protein